MVSGLYRVENQGGESVYAGSAIETSAAINPGSDGGPIVDALGDSADREPYVSPLRWQGLAVPMPEILAGLPSLKSGEVKLRDVPLVAQAGPSPFLALCAAARVVRLPGWAGGRAEISGGDGVFLSLGRSTAARSPIGQEVAGRAVRHPQHLPVGLAGLRGQPDVRRPGERGDRRGRLPRRLPVEPASSTSRRTRDHLQGQSRARPRGRSRPAATWPRRSTMPRRTWSRRRIPSCGSGLSCRKRGAGTSEAAGQAPAAGRGPAEDLEGQYVKFLDPQELAEPRLGLVARWVNMGGATPPYTLNPGIDQRGGAEPRARLQIDAAVNYGNWGCSVISASGQWLGYCRRPHQPADRDGPPPVGHGTARRAGPAPDSGLARPAGGDRRRAGGAESGQGQFQGFRAAGGRGRSPPGLGNEVIVVNLPERPPTRPAFSLDLPSPPSTTARWTPGTAFRSRGPAPTR